MQGSSNALAEALLAEEPAPAASLGRSRRDHHAARSEKRLDAEDAAALGQRLSARRMRASDHRARPFVVLNISMRGHEDIVGSSAQRLDRSMTWWPSCRQWRSRGMGSRRSDPGEANPTASAERKPEEGGPRSSARAAPDRVFARLDGQRNPSSLEQSAGRLVIDKHLVGPQSVDAMPCLSLDDDTCLPWPGQSVRCWLLTELPLAATHHVTDEQ